MGTTTSKQEKSESKEVKNDEIGDGKTPPVEQNEYKGDEQEQKDEKEPVIEEEIVPTDSIQVRSFLAAPGVSFKV